MNPEATFLLQLFLAIGLLTSIGGNVALIVGLRRKQHREVSPQPLIVQKAAEMVSQQDCQSRHQVVVKDLEDLKEGREHDRAEAGERRRLIYQELQKTNERVATQIDAVRRELSAKIEDMPSQIISILRNTGALQ